MVSSKVIGKGLPSKDVTMCHVKKMLFCLPAPAAKNGGVRRLLKKELCLHFTSIEYDTEAPVFILHFFATCNFQYYPLTDAKGVSDSINGSSSFRFLPIGLL
ncbi:unnamed protein product [Prunus armeniaca]